MNRIILLSVSWLLVLHTTLYGAFKARANIQAGEGQRMTSGTVTVGSVVIDGVTYQKIEGQPIIRVGKLQAGLSLRLYLDSENKLKDADGNGKPDEWETWRDVVSKILFIQYARKGAKPLYGRLGDIYSAKLGHGFIMDRFKNNLNDLARRKIGMEFDLDLKKFGFESMTNDITKFDIVGVRPYFRPFSRSNIKLLKNMAVGVSLVMDRNIVSNYEDMHFGFNENISDADKDGIIDEPYVEKLNLNIPDTYVDKVFNSPYDTAYNELKNKALTCFGFDIETVLFENSFIRAKLYGDFAFIKDYGAGFAFPGIEGYILGFLRMKGEFRSYDSDFIPSIFDGYYESKRMRLTDDSIVTILDDLDVRKNGERKSGGYFQIGYEKSRYVYFLASYENYMNDRPRLYGVFEIKPELVQRYSNQRLGLKVTYEQRNLPPIREFSFKNENTIMRTIITYGVSANVDMKYIYIRTFDSYGRPTDSTSIEMSMRF